MSLEFEEQIPPFEQFFRDLGTDSDIPDYIQAKVEFLKNYVVNSKTGTTWWNWMLDELDVMSQVSEISPASAGKNGLKNLRKHKSYPNQGMVITELEGDIKAQPPLKNAQPKFPREIRVERYSDDHVEMTLVAWIYYLELFNHPERLANLFAQSEIAFQPPKKVRGNYSKIFTEAKEDHRSITIQDLALVTQGADADRSSRTDRFREGPFVNYGKDKVTNGENKGRKQARSIIVGGANPDVFGSAMAVSTLAQAHSLAPLPRDGFFADTQRQVDLAKKVFEWNKMSPVLVGKTEAEQTKLIEFWNHNVVGVIEANEKKAIKRAEALYAAGVRTFRIYSPEPGNGPLKTLKALRAKEQENGWEPIEILVGQVVSLDQAKALEAEGANAIYIGIGGGGRCITGVVGNLTIDWPQLLFEMRGEITIPIIVEGGASDAIGVTLILGASGIGAVGKLAGNIENPGGYSVLVDEKTGKIFVYYGGEASDRMRAMAGRLSPFGRVEFTEGESRRIEITVVPGKLPTMLQALLDLIQGEIGVSIFQNARTLQELQDKGVRSVRKESANGNFMKNTH